MNNFVTNYLYFLGLLVAVFCLQSCIPEDSITTDPANKLSFSTDTLSFDTVFTTVGSTTKEILVYNPHQERIIISSIELGAGENSQFRINVDGIATDRAEDIEMWPEDSIYVFIELTVDPNDENLPFVLEDSLVFNTNTNIQDVNLVAWGQNANFYGRNSPNGEIVCDQVWTNDKPHIIYGAVFVDTLCALTIEKGAKVYFHSGAALVVDGTLKVNGGTDTLDRVEFRGDRLDRNYLGFDDYWERVPGFWFSIVLRETSKENVINGALIRNSLYGVVVEFPAYESTQPKLVIQNSIIRDVLGGGIIATASSVVAANCAIFNSNGPGVFFQYGGTYQFGHCTLANYSFDYTDHKSPLLLAWNFFPYGDGTYESFDLNASFFNSIIYGGEDEEVALDSVPEAAYNIQFVNCLLKTEEDPERSIFENCDLSRDYLRNGIFLEYTNRDMQLAETSAAIDKGELIGLQVEGMQIPLDKDILGRDRDEMPDLGAYEFFPE